MMDRPAPSPADRRAAEQAFHDAQAAARRASWGDDVARELRFASDAYLNHESWIAPAMALLGSVQGCRVLDYGCGHGMASVVLARAGACVVACDVAGGYVREAADRATANDVADRVAVVQADGERLPFADAVFDRVWGHAILHHLDARVAAAELRRVLAPGGKAVLCEPWGGNPLLELARQRWWYPGKHRTVDEHPLRPTDLDALRTVFPGMRVWPHQLLGMTRRLWPSAPWQNLLDRADAALFRHWPQLHRLCRYLVLEMPA
jgi:SAM-dependent methyltransferase